MNGCSWQLQGAGQDAVYVSAWHACRGVLQGDPRVKWLGAWPRRRRTGAGARLWYRVRAAPAGWASGGGQTRRDYLLRLPPGDSPLVHNEQCDVESFWLAGSSRLTGLAVCTPGTADTDVRWRRAPTERRHVGIARFARSDLPATATWQWHTATLFQGSAKGVSPGIFAVDPTRAQCIDGCVINGLLDHDNCRTGSAHGGIKFCKLNKSSNSTEISVVLRSVRLAVRQKIYSHRQSRQIFVTYITLKISVHHHCRCRRQVLLHADARSQGQTVRPRLFSCALRSAQRKHDFPAPYSSLFNLTRCFGVRRKILHASQRNAPRCAPC